MRAQATKLFILWLVGFLLLRLPQATLASQPKGLSLRSVVTISLQENPTLKNVCDAVQGARYGLDIAAAEFDVRFSPQASSGLANDTQTSQSSMMRFNKKFSHGTEVELSAGAAATDSDFFRSFSGITVSQALFGGFGRLANTSDILSAQDRIDTAKRLVDLTMEQVIQDVISTFYRIVGQQEVLRLLDKSLARAQHLHKAAEAKVSRGLATKIEVFQAQNQLATAESSLLDGRETLEEAKDTLKLLLGQDLLTQIEVSSQIHAFAIEPHEQELIAKALQERLEVQEAQAQVKSAQRELEIAQRQLLPTIRVGFNYSLTGKGGSFMDSTHFDDSSFRFLLSGSMPLSRTAEKAKHQQARLEVRRKKRDLHRLREKIKQEVRQALRRLSTVQRRIVIQEKSVEVNQSNQELSLLRFDRGYASTQDVLQAEESLMQAQKELIALRIAQINASLGLRKASGQLLTFIQGLVHGDETTQLTPCL